VEQLQIRSHLKNCPSCGAEYESLLKTKRVLATLAYRTPKPGFDDEIIQYVKAESATGKARLDPETWWTLLSESQRNRFRFATVTSLFAIAGLLWVRAPGIVERNRQELASLQRTVPSAYSAPVRINVPEYEYMVIHGAGTGSMPISGGADFTSVGKPELAGFRTYPTAP
jgi:hypothetical protein